MTQSTAIPLTEDNVQKLQDYHKMTRNSQPMPNDPSNLIKTNKSIVTQVWVCVKVDGIQITVPSERPTHGTHGVTVEFDELWVHTKELSHDFQSLIPLPFTHKNSRCTACQKLLQRRTSQTIPTTPNTQFMPLSGGPTPVSQYDESTHFIHCESQLKGLKLFIVKWPLNPVIAETKDNNPVIQPIFYKEIKWESGILYDSEDNKDNSIKFSRHMLTNEISISVNIDILSNLTWYTRDINIDCHWSNVKGVVSAEELAIVLSVADAFGSRYRGEKVVTPKTKPKSSRSPDWLSTWEIVAKLKADLPNLTVDVKLERQSKSSPWFRVQITDMYSEHSLSQPLLQGFFRAGDISLQFFHSKSKYCLLSLREASRPTPQFNVQNPNLQSRQSSSQYQYPQKVSHQTSTIHENEASHEKTALNSQKSKPYKLNKQTRPAIFIDYKNTRKQRQETQDGSASFDSCINAEVVGFDLLIPFTIIESLTRAANRLSALSSFHDARNGDKYRSRRHGYHRHRYAQFQDPYKIPVAVGQERVVRELDAVIPGFHTTKFKLVVYGGAIGITSDLTSVHTLTRHLQKNQYRKSDYLLYQWKIKPNDLLPVSDEKENISKEKSKKYKKKSKDEIEQSEKDRDMDALLERNEMKLSGENEHKLSISDESGSMQFPVHRMYHRCAHCDYHYQPDAYYNSSHSQQNKPIIHKKRGRKSNHNLLPSTTVILHCSHIFAFTSPSEVKPGHCVASITNNSTLDISGLRFELGHNLRTEQLLYPTMSPVNLTFAQNIKWLVATAQECRWPVGCPFEPIKNVSITADEIQIRIEPQHIFTAYSLALELQDIIQGSDIDLQQISRVSLSYDLSTPSSSDKDQRKNKKPTTSPTPPPPVPKGVTDEDVYGSTPIPPPIDHNVSDDDKNDGWETPNSDEEQDQFDLEPHHHRLNSFSYSLSKSITNTSVSHSGYHSTSSVSGIGNRWFFQNDLSSMKQSYRTDVDGRPFVNHVIYSEGIEIQEQNLRNNSLLSINDEDSKMEKKTDDSGGNKKDKKRGKKHKLSVDNQEKISKKQSERWMTWRYPSPRHVSHVSTSPIYQLLAHAILAIHDDDASISVSTAPSISVPAPPSIITTYIGRNNANKYTPQTVNTGSKSTPNQSLTDMNANPNDSDFSSKRQSFSFSRETLETEPTAPNAAIGHGYMVFVGIHAWDTVLRKYVDVDSFYVELDLAGTHQLKRMIIADEWKISWKLIPPTHIAKGAECVTQADMPSSMELAKLIRIDSQLHVGPLYSHFQLKVDQSNFAICNRSSNGVEEDLFNIDIKKTEINYGNWKRIRGKTLYQAIRVKVVGLQLTAPNYRDLSLYNITNSFQIRAVVRMRNDRIMLNSGGSSYRLGRDQMVPVTVANVPTGESSLDLYTGDIQLFFRRRLVFLTKYVVEAYTKIFKQTLSQHNKFLSKYQYNEPYGRETKVPGYSTGLHPSTEYVLENYCSLPLWYGQISSPQKRILPSKTIHPFCWWNAGEQRLRLSVDNGEHWSEPFEIDIEIPPPPSPFPTKKQKDDASQNKDKDKKATAAGGLRFKNIKGTNIQEQTIVVRIRDFRCEIIVRIEQKLRNNFTKISFFPEFRIQNILSKTIAIRLHQPRYKNSLPEQFANNSRITYIKPKQQYFFMVFTSTSRIPGITFGRKSKCELLYRIVDDEDDKELLSPKNGPINTLHNMSTDVESDQKLLTNFFENCEGMHIRSSQSNVPQVQVTSARPTPKMKDKHTNYTHYLKFKEYCWIVQEFKDPFFAVTIRPFMTFKNETCEEIWVLNDMVLRKTRTRLKRLSIRGDTPHSSPSKTQQHSSKENNINGTNDTDTAYNDHETNDIETDNLDTKDDEQTMDDSKDDKKTMEISNTFSEYPLLNISPKLIRAHGAHLMPGNCIDFLMIPDMREEKELKLYIATKNDILVATHFVRPLIYTKERCVSFDARWVPIDIEEQKESNLTDTNIIESDDDNLAVDTTKTDGYSPRPSLISVSNNQKKKLSFDENDEEYMNKDPELDMGGINEEPTKDINPMVHVDSTESMGSHTKSGNIVSSETKQKQAGAMAKIIVLRQHTFSSFYATVEQKQNIKIIHESGSEPTLPNRNNCSSKFMQYSQVSKRRAAANWNPISPSNIQDLDFTTVCISVQSTYTVRNRTAHKVHLKCQDFEEKYVGEEIIVIEPHSNQALFWPRDISPVLRVALEANDSSKAIAACKWCRPVTLTKEDSASYQIHMKSGPYLHVCVLTHDRIDSERIQINIRPKHIIHNKIGRPLLLWPCGMIDRQSTEMSINALDASSIVTIQNSSVVNIAQWRMEFDDIKHNQKSNSSPRETGNGKSQPRVVSAAVRVTFDYKHDIMSTKSLNQQSSSDLQVLLHQNNWEWSKQIFIPNSMSRGRRHVMVNNHLYGYEDLISFVTLLHRSVVHTIFFRCGQPPALIRNETSHILIFSQPTGVDTPSTEHIIAPYQASAFDWRSELPDKYDQNTLTNLNKKRGVKNEKPMSRAQQELKEWEDEERIFQKTAEPTSIVFRIEDYCTSDRILLRHGLSKTVTLYRIRDDNFAQPMAPELILNIRVLIRRGTFIVEVLHIAQSNNSNAPNNINAQSRVSIPKSTLAPNKRARNRYHSQNKPQKFDGISAKIVLNSCSIRLQQEHGREIQEMTNLYLQRLVVDFSKHKQEQFPTPLLSQQQQYQNRQQSISSFPTSSHPYSATHLHPSFPHSPSLSSSATPPLTATSSISGTNNYGTNFTLYPYKSPTNEAEETYSFNTIYNINQLPPPSASICSQYSLNVKVESLQVDDQQIKPEFPVIACFDPTHRRNLNRSCRDPRMIMTIVWQSPLQIHDTKMLPNSYMLRQFQEQRDQYCHYHQKQTTFQSGKTLIKMGKKYNPKHGGSTHNPLSPSYHKHKYSGHNNEPSQVSQQTTSVMSKSPEIIYFEESKQSIDSISLVPAYVNSEHSNLERETSMTDSKEDSTETNESSNSTNASNKQVWMVDGLQSDAEISGHFPDFKLISVYLHPCIVNTTDAAIIGIHSLLNSAAKVNVPDFESQEFMDKEFGNIPYGLDTADMSIRNSDETTKVLGIDKEFIALIRSVTGPRLYIHSCNIFELTFRLSVSFGEIPVHIGVHHSPLVLQPISLSSVQCAPDRLIHEIAAMYMADLAFQTPALLGSLNALGNPTQLIENIGMGFHKFVSIPRASLADGPQAFVWGAGRGFVALLQHVSEGTFTSLSTFSDSLARNLERLSSDDQYTRVRQRMRNADSFSVFSGIGSFAHSVMGGISGVVQNPSRGYSDGAWGFIKGVGTGLVGAFTKPISGALDLVAAASRSIARATGAEHKQIVRRCELSENPFICAQYSKSKYFWIALRRNEHYILHIPNVKINKVRIKKSETKYRKRTKCTIVLTDCGVFIVDDPINDDKIGEVLDWTETSLNIVCKEKKDKELKEVLSMESVCLSGSSYRAIVTGKQMKQLNDTYYIGMTDINKNSQKTCKMFLKNEYESKENILLSSYHTGELLSFENEMALESEELNNDDMSLSSHSNVAMTHPHTIGPIALFISIANKQNRNRFKLVFNSLRSQSLQMVEFWKKECTKRRKSHTLKLKQQKELQCQLQQHIQNKIIEKSKAKKKMMGKKKSFVSRQHSQSLSYSESSMVEHQYHRHMLPKKKWNVLRKSQSEKRFTIKDDNETMTEELSQNDLKNGTNNNGDIDPDIDDEYVINDNGQSHKYMSLNYNDEDDAFENMNDDMNSMIVADSMSNNSKLQLRKPKNLTNLTMNGFDK